MPEEFDVEFIDRSDREARFVVRGVTPALANGLRRAMIADVPTLSIETLRVVENSSVMFDEVVGLRLGLVPLTTDVEDFAEDDTVTLSLDVEGPGTAYSGDIVTSEPTVEPADDNVPIIELKEDQRIEVEAEAGLGTGRDHAKHQGAVATGYRHLQRVEVVGDRDEYAEEDAHIVRGVVEDDGELVPAEEFDNDLTNRYPDEEVRVEDVENTFVFHVESDGAMPVDDLVLYAVETLHARADELEEAVAL